MLLATAAANAGVIVWLWLHGGGVSGVHDWPGFWTSVGRITGLLASYLSLIQVLLLVRLPWLERLVGFDRLSGWHRWNGHAVPLARARAHGVDHRRLRASTTAASRPSSGSFFSAHYPGMVTATVGTRR